MPFPGTVPSGLSDGWGTLGLSTQEEGAEWPKDGRENFGLDLALAQHILGQPARPVDPESQGKEDPLLPP